MPITNAIASLAVRNLASAQQWYEKLLGRAADSTPMPEVAEWKFDHGGWLQVYQGPERAGHGSCTLAVSDLDEAIAGLVQKGIDPGSPMISEKAKVVMIKDPDGNSFALSQAIDKTMAR